MESDFHLLQRIANDDDRALATMMETYREPLFRFVMRSIGNESDAVEIVADAFVRLYRNAAGFKPQAKVSTWLYAITANLCRDHHRRQKRKRWLSFWSPIASDDVNELNLSKVVDETSDTHAEVATNELQERLEAQISVLPDRLRAPFVLHVLEGHSQLECGEILGISEKAVETRIYRARKLLMERLDR
jgi:RNA polymerase sigma factor CnrH